MVLVIHVLGWLVGVGDGVSIGVINDVSVMFDRSFWTKLNEIRLWNSTFKKTNQITKKNEKYTIWYSNIIILTR